MKLALVHRHSGASHDVSVIDTEPGYRRQLRVRFAFEELTLDLEDNALVLYKGGRVTRRFPWRVPPVELVRVRQLHFLMCRQKGDVMRRKAP